MYSGAYYRAGNGDVGENGVKAKGALAVSILRVTDQITFICVVFLIDKL